MNLQTLSLFPTAVMKGNIGRSLTKEELSIIDYHSDKTILNFGNVTSEEHYILNKHPELKDLKQYIEECINHYVHNIISPSNDVTFYITQSWLNYTKKGEFHHKHTHPNSIVSGVFYFHADQFFDKIKFFSAIEYKQIDFDVKNYNLYNSPSWWIETGTGDLVLFPSNLTHTVDPTLGDDTRISLAFNTFAKGSFGSEQNLSSLYL